jgi:PemK-like, MazF-like toxin of type II toxin-antitoxin system
MGAICGRTRRMGCARLIWRGEVYCVDLGRPIGHEPAFTRPAVVVSVDILNNGSGYEATSNWSLSTAGWNTRPMPAVISCGWSRSSG